MIKGCKRSFTKLYLPALGRFSLSNLTTRQTQEGDCWQGDKESGRTNDQDLDLNRNFPDQFRPNDDSLRSRSELLDGRAPETQAVMNWILENPFVLSASLHGGAVVVSYPFDDSK